ncbi:MAG TPA: lysophospholipid acyltransferase family protein [Candidatus Binatia bacterium]|nr:lysophospholipid acyltransferase family protein [Candidatus Binatia bacterium]
MGDAKAAGGEVPKRAPVAPIVSRHDAFRERLRDLDRIVERTAAESGASLATGSPLADAVELALDGWAQLARAVESGALLALPGLRSRAARIPAVDDFGYDREFEAWVAPVFRALYRVWWRVDVAGLEHLPDSGRALLVANHSGGFFAYDGAMLKIAVQDQHPAHRALRPLVDDFVYNLPFLGDFMTRCGGVRACPENAERLLARDEAVVVFPEGTKGIGKLFRDRYRLARFGRGGFVRIALRTRSPIVPVAVIGGEEIHPLLARWDWMARFVGLPYFPLTPTFPWLGLLGVLPLPSKWRIEVGEPIDWRDRYGPDAARDRLLVSRLREEVRDRVQELVRGALARRGSAFF